MKYRITRDLTEVDYQDSAFWQQFDEVEVEVPQGWHIKYVEGGIVHSFGYSQSSGRGEYLSEYREDTYNKPLPFTSDSKKNAEIMKKKNYDNKKAQLIREP